MSSEGPSRSTATSSSSAAASPRALPTYQPPRRIITPYTAPPRTITPYVPRDSTEPYVLPVTKKRRKRATGASSRDSPLPHQPPPPSPSRDPSYLNQSNALSTSTPTQDFNGAAAQPPQEFATSAQQPVPNVSPLPTASSSTAPIPIALAPLGGLSTPAIDARNGATNPDRRVEDDEKRKRNEKKGIVAEPLALTPQERRRIFSDFGEADKYVDHHYCYIDDDTIRHRILNEYIYTCIHDLAKYAKQTGRAIFLSVSDMDHRDPLRPSQPEEAFDIIYTSPQLRDPRYPRQQDFGQQSIDTVVRNMAEIRGLAHAEAIKLKQLVEDQQRDLIAAKEAAKEKDQQIAQQHQQIAQQDQQIAQLEESLRAKSEAQERLIAELQAQLAQQSATEP